MTTECYYGECRFHGTHSGEEGPFCFEATCLASAPEIKLLETIAAMRKQCADKDSKAYEYAKAIVTSIWEKHYKESCPQWEPCDNLMGVLSQLDNMLVGHPPIPQAGHVGYFDVYDDKDGDKHYIHIKDKYADGSSVRLYAAAPSLPEGWQLVPVEPTDDQAEQGKLVNHGMHSERKVYRAMLSAAPKPKEFP